MKNWMVSFFLLVILGLLYTLSESQKEVLQLKKDYATEREKQASDHLAQVLKLQGERDGLRDRLADLEAESYEELIDAQQTTDDLTDQLALANRRLSVRASCPAPGNDVRTGSGTGLDDGSGIGAVLHPAVAADLARLAGDADRCRVKLKGLQDREREFQSKDDKPP